MPELPSEMPSSSAGPRPSPWRWMGLACAIIAASGLVRLNQERLFADAARAAQEAPFTIRDLPRELNEGGKGRWIMQGEEGVLDEDTLQIAGCSDYMYRHYVDKSTGVVLTVLVAFGPANRVFPHSPVVCFPANGYKPRGRPSRRKIELGGPGAARGVDFSVHAYGKSGGGADELEEVFYSFWHDGRWDPEATQTKNRFHHRPAMFKVQVERSIGENEINARESPIEGFLAALIPEIERRYDAMAVETRTDD